MSLPRVYRGEFPWGHKLGSNFIDFLLSLLKNVLMAKKVNSSKSIATIVLGVILSLIVGFVGFWLANEVLLMLFPPTPITCSGSDGIVPCLAGFEVFRYFRESTAIAIVIGLFIQMVYFKHIMKVAALYTFLTSSLSLLLTLTCMFFLQSIDNVNLLAPTLVLGYPLFFMLIILLRPYTHTKRSKT